MFENEELRAAEACECGEPPRLEARAGDPDAECCGRDEPEAAPAARVMVIGFGVIRI